MKNQKEKEKFFERMEISDPEYAQKVYNKEHNWFKFKLICAGIALPTSIIWFFSDAIKDLPVISTVMAIIMSAGYVAALISCPFMIIKTVFKVARFMYALVPFILLDVFAGAIGLVAALFMFLYAPAVYCAIGIYQSYKNLNEAKAFLAYYDASEVIEVVEE